VAARQDRRQGGGTGARVLAALPAIAFALFIVIEGGLVFALGILALGIVALTELYGMMGRVRPANLAGFLAVAALVLAALYGEPKQLVLVIVAAFPVTFLLALMRPRRENISWAMAVTLFGVLWIGLPLAHAVLLRELGPDSHGMGLMLDVLIGTFIGDTTAYFGGRMYGRTPLAPRISPNKTVAGLVCGALGATAAVWFAGLYQDWLSGVDALLIGLSVALAAPVGDLFESAIKRDLEVKDTGHFFGAHGGVLDRLDAALFTLPVAYYVAVALGYG
jgi:phosphatidate cytidylyltransferase